MASHDPDRWSREFGLAVASGNVEQIDAVAARARHAILHPDSTPGSEAEKLATPLAEIVATVNDDGKLNRIECVT